MKEAEYGDKWADIYDDLYPPASTSLIDFLVAEAGPGPVLELGIGTGRVALLLKKKGIDIHGIDASSKMMDKLKEKEGGKDIPVKIGNFIEIQAPPYYSMIYAVFNSFFGLQSREDQIKGFQSISDALLPGGRFIIEAIIPDLSSFDKNQAFSVVSITPTEVVLNASQIDPTAQTLMGQRIHISEGGIKLLPTEFRWVWPSELDLMANSAGLPLIERFGSWTRTPFTQKSTVHISIYEKPKKQ